MIHKYRLIRLEGHFDIFGPIDGMVAIYPLILTNKNEMKRSVVMCNDKSFFQSAKSFSWSKYLERRRAQAAPERLFSDPFPYGKHGFRPGMKLEGIDPEHQSLFCVLTVVEVQGSLQIPIVF